MSKFWGTVHYTNSFTIKKEEIVDTETTEKDELGIFVALGSSTLLVGTGYLTYKRIKKNLKRYGNIALVL